MIGVTRKLTKEERAIAEALREAGFGGDFVEQLEEEERQEKE